MFFFVNILRSEQNTELEVLFPSTYCIPGSVPGGGLGGRRDGPWSSSQGTCNSGDTRGKSEMMTGAGGRKVVL